MGRDIWEDDVSKKKKKKDFLPFRGHFQSLVPLIFNLFGRFVIPN